MSIYGHRELLWIKQMLEVADFRNDPDLRGEVVEPLIRIYSKYRPNLAVEHGASGRLEVRQVEVRQMDLIEEPDGDPWKGRVSVD